MRDGAERGARVPLRVCCPGLALWSSMWLCFAMPCELGDGHAYIQTIVTCSGKGGDEHPRLRVEWYYFGLLVGFGGAGGEVLGGVVTCGRRYFCLYQVCSFVMYY